MSEGSLSLFDRMGGAEKLRKIVEEMYQRVLGDESLAPFFEHVAMDKLRKMQFEFLASALDGPVSYAGAELTQIHRGRGITSRHFSAFCGHFADAAQAEGIEPATVDSALIRLSMYKDKITGDANVDG